MVTKFTEFSAEDVVFRQLHANTYIPAHRISWNTRTDKSKLIIQTPKVLTETYGVPREGVLFTTDKSKIIV